MMFSLKNDVPCNTYESFAFDSHHFNFICFSHSRLVTRLEENNPSEVEVFKTNINKVMKDLLGRFKDLQFFTGESMDCEGLIAMLEYRDIDGESTPVLLCFKHGLEEEKF